MFLMSHARVSWYLGLEPKKAEEELSEENGAEAILNSRNTLTLDIYVKARLDAFGRVWPHLASTHLNFSEMG